MARLALTLTLFIALFIILTGAKHPLDLPDDDTASNHDPSITLPEPESKRTILLPSEKPESEPATVVELDQNEIEATVLDTERDMEEEVKPEMRIAFRDLRPVWPQDADQKMMFVLRHPHHRCHHPHGRPHHQHHQIVFRQFDVERPESEPEPEPEPEPEREYGNDMLVADLEMEKGFEQRERSLENDMLVADPGKRFDEGAFKQDLTEIHVGRDGGRRHAPSGWVGLHFGGRPRFPFNPDHEHGPHHHHHHDHEEDRRDHHRPDDEDEHRHDHDGLKRPFGFGRHEESGGGLVKRIRKFLHQIDF